MPNDTDNTAGRDCPEATCSAVSTPAEELAHLKEVARNNGHDSITDAIVKAKRYMDEIKRLRRVLHDIAGSRPDEYMDVEKTPELVKWICETCRNASVGAYPPNAEL